MRYRTKKLPGGKYIHIAVTKKSGPRGGKTIAGRIHKKKRLVFFVSGRTLLFGLTKDPSAHGKMARHYNSSAVVHVTDRSEEEG